MTLDERIKRFIESHGGRVLVITANRIHSESEQFSNYGVDIQFDVRSTYQIMLAVSEQDFERYDLVISDMPPTVVAAAAQANPLFSMLRERILFSDRNDVINHIKVLCHDYYAIKDAELKANISDDLLNCGQQRLDKVFAYFSDTVYPLMEKRSADSFRAFPQDQDLSRIDFTRFAAIRIDNDHNKDMPGLLGKGYETLQRLANHQSTPRPMDREKIDEIISNTEAVSIMLQGLDLGLQLRQGIRPVEGVELRTPSQEGLEAMLDGSDVFDQGSAASAYQAAMDKIGSIIDDIPQELLADPTVQELKDRMIAYVEDDGIRQLFKGLDNKDIDTLADRETYRRFTALNERFRKDAAELITLMNSPRTIPIIYETAHRLEDFDKVNPDTGRTYREMIESHGAILMPKMCFFKLQLGRQRAEKEIEIDSLTQRNPRLYRHIAKIEPVGDSGMVGRGDIFVTSTRFAEGMHVYDDEEEAFMDRCGVDLDMDNHRMYVLALFHAELKEEINNPKLQATSRDFFGFDEISERVKAYLGEDKAEYLGIDNLAPIYNHVVRKHRQMAPTTVTHNDAKWDNWFEGSVLGDFGSVEPGQEYKDIANAMLTKGKGFALAKDRERVDRLIGEYIKIRQAAEEEKGRIFVPDQDFRQNVYERIVTACLRTAYYKSGKSHTRVDNKKLVGNLIDVARTYVQAVCHEMSPVVRQPSPDQHQPQY
jgi:hypothetical protein